MPNGKRRLDRVGFISEGIESVKTTESRTSSIAGGILVLAAVISVPTARERSER